MWAPFCVVLFEILAVCAKSDFGQNLDILNTVRLRPCQVEVQILSPQPGPDSSSSLLRAPCWEERNPLYRCMASGQRTHSPPRGGGRCGSLRGLLHSRMGASFSVCTLREQGRLAVAVVVVVEAVVEHAG